MWRYTVVAVNAQDAVAPRRGEMMAESAAEARAALLRIGWQVVDLHRTRKSHDLPGPMGELWRRHLRARRRDAKAEIYEGLGALLESGLPLLECLDVLRDERSGWTNRGRQVMMAEWRAAMHGGAGPAQALGRHPAWFDTIDCAMIEAGERGGMLPTVLRQMAQRQQRSGHLSHQLMTALAYPAIITVAAGGVAIFLSVRVLPDLTDLLTSARVEVPALTRAVMSVGQLAAHWGWAIILIGVIVLLLAMLTWRRAIAGSDRLSELLSAATPSVFRRWATARLAQTLSDLLRTGVPAVEALRLAAATAPLALAHIVRSAADKIEQGRELPEVLADPHWFSPQFQRLLHSGLAAGELEDTLQRLAQREENRTERQLKRLATLLEPAAILVLATLVGTVVLAAVLPLTRLQEVIH